MHSSFIKKSMVYAIVSSRIIDHEYALIWGKYSPYIMQLLKLVKVVNFLQINELVINLSQTTQTANIKYC